MVTRNLDSLEDLMTRRADHRRQVPDLIPPTLRSRGLGKP